MWCILLRDAAINLKLAFLIWQSLLPQIEELCAIQPHPIGISLLDCLQFGVQIKIQAQLDPLSILGLSGKFGFPTSRFLTVLIFFEQILIKIQSIGIGIEDGFAL